MSSPRKAQFSAADKEGPPFVGGLLRMAYQAVRQRQLEAHKKRGFNDLNQALLNVLVYPPPDGARPAELADQRYMTKQAMNYLLGQLESLGYIERRAEKAQGRRLVFLTHRGWQVFESQWAAAQQLEQEWAALVGKTRFDEFMRTLRELVSLQSNTAPKHGRAGQPAGSAKRQRVTRRSPKRSASK